MQSTTSQSPLTISRPWGSTRLKSRRMKSRQEQKQQKETVAAAAAVKNRQLVQSSCMCFFPASPISNPDCPTRDSNCKSSCSKRVRQQTKVHGAVKAVGLGGVGAEATVVGEKGRRGWQRLVTCPPQHHHNHWQVRQNQHTCLSHGGVRGREVE